MTRLVVANLDAEAELAGATLAPRARSAASVFGALLAGWCRAGDELWLPCTRRADLPQLRLSEGTGPTLVCGDLAAAAARHDEVLAWCETPSVATARAARPTLAADGRPQRAGPTQASAATHHRRFAFEFGKAHGLGLEAARWATSAADLAAAARDAGATSPTRLGWVLKAPLSAAGRDRWRGRLDDEGRAAAERFLGLHGQALLEPWQRRVADFGWVGWVDEAGPVAIGAHVQRVDVAGRFVGIEIPGDVTADDAGRLDEVGLAVGRELWTRGLRGGYGIDAWRWQCDDGSTALHALGEVNARLTMGHVARVWHHRRPNEPTQLGATRGDAAVPSAAPRIVASTDALTAFVV